MITIISDSGDVKFLNENEFIRIDFNKSDRKVVAHPIQRNAHIGMPYPIIEVSDVQSIAYTNEAQPTMWQDEGSELLRLHKILKEKLETIDRLTLQKKAIENDLHHFAFEMEQVACHYSGKIPAEVVRQIQTPALAMKSKVLNKSYDKQQ